MKIVTAIVAVTLICLQSHAQEEAPKGFKKGTLTLADKSVLNGYVKDNIRNSASVILINGSGDKKKTYDGSALSSAEIDGTKFLCINGDFFRIICEGNLNFLQKESDASGKPSYNGTEAVSMNGTEGSRGDYFIYDNKSRQLKLVTKKNFDVVIAGAFANNTAAIEKANTARNDLPRLKEAVESYNASN